MTAHQHDVLDTTGSAIAGAGFSILMNIGESLLYGFMGAVGGLIFRLIYKKWLKRFFE